MSQRLKKGTGKPRATGNLESMVIPSQLPTADPIAQTDAEVQGNSLREDEQNFSKLPEQQKLTNSAPKMVSRRIMRKDNSSLHLMMIHMTV